MTVKPKKLINTFNKIGQGVLHISALLGIIDDFIIESGSNSNGKWEKHLSGKLVQTKQIIVSLPAGEPWQSVFYNDINMGNWAIPFHRIEWAKENLRSNTYWSNCAGYTTSSAGTVRAFRITSGTVNDLYVTIEGKGLWK